MTYESFQFLLLLLILSVTLISSQTYNRSPYSFRILGGYTCSTEKYPFQLLVLRNKPGAAWVRHCGGTLLNKNWALTAAHCAKNKILAVIVAANHPQGKSKIIEVEKAVLHPEYVVKTFKNDVALLKLQKSVERSSHVDYVKLPTLPGNPKENQPPCSRALIMGWGKMNNKNPNSVPVVEELQCAYVPMKSSEQCRKLYYSKHRVKANYNFLCTLSTEGIDSCQGDSGGPLLCGDVQVGIVSWGLKCGDPTSPGIYMRIDLFLDFISITMSTARSLPKGNDNNGSSFGILVDSARVSIILTACFTIFV